MAAATVSALLYSRCWRTPGEMPPAGSSARVGTWHRWFQAVIVIDSSNSSERTKREINTTMTESAPTGEEKEASSDIGRERPREQEELC